MIIFWTAMRMWSWVRGEGSDGVVVFEGPLGMAKGDTSGYWSEYGALAPSSSKRPCLAGVEAFLQPNVNPTPLLQA